MRNILCLLFASLYMVGCSSINQPVASRALVEYTFSSEQKNVPSAFWQTLSSAKFGNEIIINQQPAELGQQYFSANGRTCRKILWRDNNIDSLARVICKSSKDDSWQYVKSVMSEYIEGRSPVRAGQ